MKIFLITSNINKLNELVRLGLPISGTKNIDLPEVFADPITVALYKSKEAGSNTLIEDTIIKIDNNDLVDIRWRINKMVELSESSAVKWMVTLAHNDGIIINIYCGEILCKINPKSLMAGFKPDKGAFGFDEYLIPQLNDKTGVLNKLTLYELEQLGNKDFFSPRRLAVENFISGIKTKSMQINELKPWCGEFQNS